MVHLKKHGIIHVILLKRTVEHFWQKQNFYTVTSKCCLKLFGVTNNC